jgi:hypothetical protein
MMSAIYTYPEPYQGFVRLDCIAEAIAAPAIPETRDGTAIPPRVVIRIRIGRDHSDAILECASYEEACKRVNQIRARVEEYHAATTAH